MTGRTRWTREPLVHFVLLGAVIFAADAWLRGPDESDRVIVVDASIRAEIAERLQTNLGQAPTPEELERAVVDWSKQEVLYREGLARGFDAHDPAVRSRVASRMAHVLSSSVALEPPSEAELRAYFEETPRRWDDVSRVDFTHVFVQGRGEASEERARALQELLVGGASPAGLGDRFSGGRRYRGRTIDDLSSSFGPEFVEGMAEDPIGTWVVRPSRVGFHVVRLDSRSAEHESTFEEVALRVQSDWELEQEDAALDAAEARLMARWEIVREP